MFSFKKKAEDKYWCTCVEIGDLVHCVVEASDELCCKPLFPVNNDVTCATPLLNIYAAD